MVGYNDTRSKKLIRKVHNSLLEFNQQNVFDNKADGHTYKNKRILYYTSAEFINRNQMLITTKFSVFITQALFVGGTKHKLYLQ